MLERQAGCECQHEDLGPCPIHRFDVGDTIMLPDMVQGTVVDKLGPTGWIVAVDTGGARPEFHYCHAVRHHRRW